MSLCLTSQPTISLMAGSVQGKHRVLYVQIVKGSITLGTCYARLWWPQRLLAADVPKSQLSLLQSLRS